MISHSDNFEIQEKIIKMVSWNMSEVMPSWKIYKIMDLNTGKKYISKIFKEELEDFSQKNILKLSREISIISKLNHPSILKIIDINFITFKNVSKLAIINEYASHYTLFQLLYPNDHDHSEDQGILDLSKSLTDTKKLIIIFGIAYGMSYLHSHDILHRDLNPFNIFLDDSFFPKITGFHNSKKLSKSENNGQFLIEGELIGLIKYLAPEIASDLKYSKATDVYAFSMIFYEVFSGDECYEFEKLYQLMVKIKPRPEFKKEVPICYQKLINKCWSDDPNKRPTFDDIVKELKTNPDFITNKINKEEYLNSIKLIENSEISFNPIQKIQQIGELIESKIIKLQDSIDDFQSKNQIESQPFCNLNNFEFELNDSGEKIFFDKKTKLRVEYECYDKEINKFLRYEIKSLSIMASIMSKSNHPSICKFIGYSPVDIDNQPKPVIITESLYYFICCPNDTSKLCIIYGIASGMAYLHSHNIIHRNLTISNIGLVNSYFPKICGFKLAKQIDEKSIKKNKKIKGTPAYIAPEVYLKKGYCKASDVYAFALIVYEILIEEKPFNKKCYANNMKRILIKGDHINFNYPIPKCYKELIEHCLSPKPKDRPTFDQILINLKTNPGFITSSVNRNDFLKYVNFLDELAAKDKTTLKLNNVLNFNLNTFPNIKPPLHLSDMLDTEMNNLSDGQKWINYHLFDDVIEDSNEYYSIYDIRKKTYHKKIILINVSYLSIDLLTKNDIINFARELTILSQLNHPSIIKYIGYYFLYGSVCICYKCYKNGILERILESQRINKLKLEGLYSSFSDSSYDESLHSSSEKKDDSNSNISSDENSDENSHTLSNKNDDENSHTLSNKNDDENSHTLSNKNDDENSHSLSDKNDDENSHALSDNSDDENSHLLSDKNDDENSHTLSNKNDDEYSHSLSDENVDENSYSLSDENNDESSSSLSNESDDENLHSLLNENNGTLDDTRKLIIIYGIAVGMSYLHLHNILHRDLKPSNIYLDKYFYPKIAGFHISKEMIGNTIQKNITIKGTPVYIAPEVYLNEGYSKSSDVYSFALLVYELMTGDKPYESMISPKEIKKSVADEGLRPKFNEIIPKCYQQLIEKCWSQEPTLRPTFDEIVSELKMNNDFITNDIDKAEFEKYIKYIENSPQGFNSSKKIQQLEEYFRFNLYKFSEFDIKINYRNTYETESDNILLKYDFINLKNFKKQKLLVDNIFEIHKIQEIHTKKQYFAKMTTINIYDFTSENLKSFFIELNIMHELNHPSLSKLIGFSPLNFKNKPSPVFVLENASNNSLSRMLEIERNNRSDSIFDDTKKLINILGIASGLAYLHSKDVIINELDLSYIFLDDFLFPKIYLVDEIGKLSENPIKCLSKDRWDEIIYLKGDIFKSPEVNVEVNYSSAGNVFSFGMIVYSIITNKLPYIQPKQFNRDSYEKNLPIINEEVPDCYKNLMQKCWSFDPIERPTFDEIVYDLKTNQAFITDKINNEEYQSYIKFIEAYQSKEIKQIDDIIKTQNLTFRKVKIDFSKLRNWPRLNFSVNIGSIDLNSFEKNSKIGSGSFGVAYKIINKKTGDELAAKVSIYEIDQCSEDIIMNLSREIRIISTLNHPSILRFHGYCPNNFKNKPKPVIITEYAINGSLDKILEMERNGMANLDWNDTKKLINIYGIASGMAYLHRNNIIHRDLKPGNIFIDEYLYPKIADFGLSKNLKEEKFFNEENEKNKGPISSGFKGTFAYCSPEILVNQEYKKSGDVYAFAMIVYEIMTNEIPFEGFNQYKLFWEVTHNDYRPKFKFSIPYSYRKLIEKCWNKDTRLRPKFPEIVELLEKDQGFITRNVNQEEFLNYVSYINEYVRQNSLVVKEEENQPKPQNDQKINKVSIGLKIIEDEEDNSSQLNECFIDLNKYERLDIVNKEDTYKICQIREKETGNIFAAQMSMIKIYQLTKEEEDKISKETEVISQLNHPSILKFIGFSPIDFKKERKPVIIMEFASNGTLGQVLEIERNDVLIQGWDETKKIINIYGIASGMAYFHSKNIIHRCLKPSNIYLDDALLPKIGDFGLSSRFYNVDLMSHQSISGNKATPIYSAPEILQYNEFSKMSDVYAFAFIVYEILMKEVPFKEIVNSNKIFNEVVIKNQRPKIDEKIPKCYRYLIEKCWAQDINERPTFDEIVYNFRNNPDFITSEIKKEDYFKYIELIDSQMNSESNQKIELTDEKINIIPKDKQINGLNTTEIETDFIEENEVDNDLISINEQNYVSNNIDSQSLSIDEYISSNRAKELMNYLNSNYDTDFISSVFDQCWNKSKDFYLSLCKEGILCNNVVAHHKYTISLIFDSNNYIDAKHHLEESMKQEFLLSYFVHSKLCYLIFHKVNAAFISAQEGAKRNEKYSKCLYGYFISHGIGTKKDFEKGIEIMLNSKADNYYEKFSTDFGIYFYNIKRDENKSFYWFKKAFNMKQTKATINNYGVCLMKGIGIAKNIEKAEEIFNIGVNQNDINSMYHLAFIQEKTKPEESLRLYKKAAKQGHFYSQIKYATIISTKNPAKSLKYFKLAANNDDSNSQEYLGRYLLNIDQNLSLKCFKKASEKGNLNAIQFLAKKYSKENDVENTYKYMNLLIKSGNFSVPLEYSLNCFKEKQFELAFKYFSIIANYNHPIAKYFIGLMKYKGLGCIQNRQDSFEIMKSLSSNGIEKATDFIENYFI